MLIVKLGSGLRGPEYDICNPMKNEMLVRKLRPDSHSVRKAAKAVA